MKVLVCGSRKWVNQQAIERELGKLPPGILVHGKAPGADNIAGYVGKRLGWEVRAYPANWVRDGRWAAGPLRNQRMLDEEHRAEEPIDLLLAFHEDPNFGKGTKDMIGRARGAVPTIDIQTFSR